MAKALAALAACASLCAAAFSPLALLTRPPEGGVPDFEMAELRVERWPDLVYPFTATTGECTPTGVTYGAWMKTVRPPREGNHIYLNYGLTGFFSPHRSLATREGGPELGPTILSVPEDEPLALDANGDWSQAGALPSTYDRGGMSASSYEDQWTHGCYCVNVKTDTALTLTIGGVAKSIAPSAGMQIFNVNDLTASRDVSVHAASPDAVVYLALAENPLVRFYGGDMMNTAGATGGLASDPLAGFCGINDDEWQMVAIRAYVTPESNVVHRVDAYAADMEYPSRDGWVTEQVFGPHLDAAGRPCFAPWSRLSMAAFTLAPATNETETMWVRGWFAKPYVMSDAELVGRRDAGVRWLRAHGSEFPRLAPDWWKLYATVVRTNEQVTTARPVELDCGAQGLVGTNGYVTSYSAVYSVTNGKASTEMVGIKDVTLMCPEGTVRGNVIDFPGPGKYVVTAVDGSGNVRTNSTTVQAASQQYTAWTEYTNDVAGTWQRMANDAVKSNCLAAAETTGKPKFRPRRIPCQPMNAAWSSNDVANGVNNFSAQGHRGGVHPISAHCVASAIHYGWTDGGWLRFVSSDGSETGCVRTARMEWMCTNGPSWFSLSAWAVGNGFSAEQAKSVADVIVHRVAEGEVPPKCRPSFMRPSTAAAHFGTAGVLGWGTTQDAVGIGVPVLFNQPSNVTWFSSWRSADKWPFESSRSGAGIAALSNVMRKDVRDEALAKCADWNFVTPYGGDSGLPLYVEVDGKFVLVSHYRGVQDGPSYVNGFEILKAWVESQGDELLEIE